jgi:two-component system chemotaxis sensor kinase CheA
LIEKIRAAEGGGATQKGALESSFLQERIRSVRVRTEKLDSLLDLAGEILIVKNSLKGQVARKELSKIEESVLLLERLSEMLTEEVLGVRLVPLESLFEGIPRLVRNLSRELGKEVILQIQGAEVELDRVTLEGLREPLLHIIRNALDHGIESPEERVAAGKTKEGHLRLEAKREESWIVLCVCDDGRGVDPEKVLKKAKERGMIDEASLENLSEEEIFDFLFQPGFSTKERASEISGMGVGLDVVKEAVSKLGGRLDFRSVKNQGLEMILRLPQSTAIIRAMIVYNDGGIYAIPLNDVSEVLKLDSASIHGFRGTRMFSYRDAVIPLISLKELLEKRDFSTEKAKRLYCFVMSRGDRSAAIAVDDIGDIQDLVIKPAEGVLAKADGISGSSVLGDARVALVLDLPSLLTKRGAWKMAQEIKDQ